MKRNITPSSVTVSSMTSRVVPCISLTMALSSPNKAFNNVDFPAFVSPTMATGTPFLITLPARYELASFPMTPSISSASANSSLLSANSKSSWSEKSSSSSISEAKCNSRSRNAVNSLLNPPRIWLMATWCAARDVEAITSATASAWLRSIFPFRKARSVNSPGRAMRQPASTNRVISSLTM